MIPPWFQPCIYEKKFVITWRHHFQATVFSMIVWLFHRSTWSDSNVEDTVYFTTLVANIHYNKWPVTDSRKIEEYCVYLKKTIIAFLFYRCLLFHRTSCINFCLISTVYILTGKLPSVRLPPLSENCPLWNCPTENCHTTNPAPSIWVRVWTKVRVRQEAVLRRAIFYVPC